MGFALRLVCSVLCCTLYSVLSCALCSVLCAYYCGRDKNLGHTRYPKHKNSFLLRKKSFLWRFGSILMMPCTENIHTLPRRYATWKKSVACWETYTCVRAVPKDDIYKSYAHSIYEWVIKYSYFLLFVYNCYHYAFTSLAFGSFLWYIIRIRSKAGSRVRYWRLFRIVLVRLQILFATVSFHVRVIDPWVIGHLKR
jgi:hypothetical protein